MRRTVKDDEDSGTINQSDMLERTSTTHEAEHEMTDMANEIANEVAKNLFFDIVLPRKQPRDDEKMNNTLRKNLTFFM